MILIIALFERKLSFSVHLLRRNIFKKYAAQIEKNKLFSLPEPMFMVQCQAIVVICAHFQEVYL